MACEVDIYLFKVDPVPGRNAIGSILDMMDSSSTIVIVDRDAVFSEAHLSSAILHAARSMIRGRSRARAPSLEVIRWLSGSHQVSRGIEVANPGKETTHILVLDIPHHWPRMEDIEDLPVLVGKIWNGPVLEGLVPVDPPFDMGGEKALDRLGIVPGETSSMEEMEKMVLETVCLPALR